MAATSNRVGDVFLSLEGGIDSGWSPLLIQPNQVSFAVNTTFRDGFPTCRPPWVKRPVTYAYPFDGAYSDFEDGLFQGAGTYYSDQGHSYLAVSVSGRVYLIDVTNKFFFSEITPADDENQPTQPHAWFQQAENYLVVQNGINRAILFNGSSARRAADDEVPIGGPMAYGKGRLWVASGNSYSGGDLVWSSEELGRGSVIKWTENTFLNEGGRFAVPGGNITGLAFAANLDTALGQGDLLVFTPSAVFNFDAPIDREVWKDLQYPIQRFALLNFGSLNHESIVPINGDIVFRAQDGIRSLVYARRDFTDWGNTPISRQAVRALKYDTIQRLYAASAVNFDNRLLMTVQPNNVNNHGIYHKGLVVLDYNNVAGMGRKLSPAWEGVWTGVNILQILTCSVSNVDRCFAFVLSAENKIEIWELLRYGDFDNGGDDNVRIQWSYETRAVTMNLPNEIKRLTTSDQWMDKVTGEVDVSVFYRADQSECWTHWVNFSECAEYRSCAEPEYGGCQEVRNFRKQVRSRIGLMQPPDVNDPQRKTLTRWGFDFQLRYEITGKCRMTRTRILADRVPQDDYGDMSGNECVPSTTAACQTGCKTQECCDPDDFGYSVTPA